MPLVVYKVEPGVKWSTERLRNCDLCSQSFDTNDGGGLVIDALRSDNPNFAHIVSPDQVKVACPSCTQQKLNELGGNNGNS